MVPARGSNRAPCTAWLPDAGLRLGAVQQLHRGADGAQLGVAAAQILHAGGRMGAVQGAAGHRLAVDAVLFDPREHQGGGAGQQGRQAVAGIGAEMGVDVLGRQPEARVHQPDIAAGAAAADLCRLDQLHRGAEFRRRRAAEQPV